MAFSRDKFWLFFIIVVGLSLWVIRSTVADDASEVTLEEVRVQPDGFGGGAYDLGAHVPHLTRQQRQDIQSEIADNIALLQQRGILAAVPMTPTVTLAWPLKLADGLNDFGYHAISNFVDHNSNFPGQLLDYACDDRTYDTSGGYNHAGTDFFTWPFSWNKMDNDEVEIVAVADGVIVGKSDGNYDRSCSPGGTWNAVYVRHADNSVAWYGHMKNGSVTSKGVGMSVVAGEYLGIVGSSGNSTGPHLHLEVYDSDNNLIDPYAGACNGLNSESWWGTQRPYYDSAVNKITTGYAAPVFPTCPIPETSNEHLTFLSGDTIYFTTYYRDQLMSQQSQYTIYQPNGAVYASWSHSSNADHYNSSYWWWYFNSVVGASGTWRFRVTFEGETYSYPFFLGAPDLAVAPDVTIGLSGDDLNLSWLDAWANCRYEVHRSHEAHFVPSSASLWETLAEGTGSYEAAAGEMVFFVITAVNCDGSSTADSQATGAFRYVLAPATG